MKDRAEGVAKYSDRFLMKGIQDKINKKKKDEKRAKELGNAAPKESYKSGQFFNKFQEVAKADIAKKATKRAFKETGKHASEDHGHGSSKRFKM